MFPAEEGRSDNIPTRHRISSMASPGVAASGELSAGSGQCGVHRAASLDRLPPCTGEDPTVFMRMTFEDRVQAVGGGRHHREDPAGDGGPRRCLSR